MTFTLDFDQRCCPVCGVRASQLVFSQSFEALAEIGLLAGYDVVVCDKCGAAFADHIPPQPVFDAYYRDLSKYEYQHRDGKESDNDEPRFREVVAILRSFIQSQQARVLEIGCSTGRLLSLLKESGYTNVFGLDPSSACAEAARRLYNVEVQTGTIFDPPAPDRPYDVLILLGVIEHIRDTGAALGEVWNLLSPRGRAYVEVPDAVHPIPRRDAPFQEFSTEHINFFSVVSLTNLFEAARFRKLACEYAMREYPPGARAPVVYGVFEKSDMQNTDFARDRETEKGLLQYIAACRDMEAELQGRIESVTGSGDPVIIWGLGTLTRRLLASGALATANVVAFVDSNPKYQGQVVRGVPVLAPHALKQRREPILISSYAFQNEILRQIREELRLPNQVLSL